MRRRIFLQHLVHSSSWIHKSSYSQYMVRNIFFTTMDYPTKNFDSVTIHIQCIAPQEGRLFIELHGQHWAKLYDGDSHILYGLGKVFPFMYVQLMYPTLCSSLVDVITYIINHVSRNNLPFNFLKQ